MRVTLLVFLAATAFSFSTQATEQPKLITPEIVASLKYVTQVAVDPTGTYIAYVLRIPRDEDEEPGGPYSEIWVVPTRGGEPRQFTSKPINSWAVAWSPDGRQLAFLSMRKEYDPHTQVYAIPIDGGEAKPLTRAKTSVRQFRWSPDGKWIAYTATDPEPEERKKAKKAGKDWEVVDRDYRHHRLWALEVATGKAHKVTTTDLSVWDFEWSPDGKQLVIQASKTPKTDDSYMFKKLYLVPLEGGEPKLLCETEGKLGAMRWSPNGRMVAFLGAVDLYDPYAGSLFIVPAEGGKPRNLTPDFEGTLTWIGWVNNRTLAFIAIEGTQTSLNLISIRDGKIQRLLASPPAFTRASLSGDRKVIACAASTVFHPSEVFAGRLKGKKLTRLTYNNPELKELTLADQETIRWKTSDGWTMTGLVMKPVDYESGKSYPLIVQVHGGPEAAYVDGWNTYYIRWTQLLAARGYVVFMPNYRGSIGRGVGFSKGDHEDLGGREFQDVLEGIDYLVDKGWVDPERVGMGGGSYGGYFSAWAATRHSERFRAAVVFAGISNWHSFTGTTDIPYEMSLVHWKLWCYDKPQLCWERSPMAYIQKANTPTLIVHGKEDRRVPLGQSWELYTALKWKGVPTELVIYPREGHGLRERAHQIDFMNRVLEWFDRYVKK